MNSQRFRYGIIEGFYGKPWTWQNRIEYPNFLSSYGFDFYLYAPKTDIYLRDQWHQNWPDSDFSQLHQLAQACFAQQVRFGIGFTPVGIKTLNDKNRQQLRSKLDQINALEVEILAILFDDLVAGHNSLAEEQLAIVDYICQHSCANQFIICPTYYSDDPVLERLFGTKPLNYWHELGRNLDPDIDLFWTGSKVVSENYAQQGLAQIAEYFQRKPFIWDNYPVNDSPRMQPFLHLRGVTGRPPALADWSAGFAANPMNQPRLSELPLATLSEALDGGQPYYPDLSLQQNAQQLLGEELGNALVADLALFHDNGLDQLTSMQIDRLSNKYSAFSGVYAQEVCDWLAGKYRVDIKLETN